ncbi:unnamed protein product [Clonostachys byssicola]|uniref:Hemolysin-III channel protein Izh2 n=1 Tax=Clonostachys byssicola TaxID=160290 RepID=A0A9N9Y2T7_9HYPO|nr:unnamed protein product [Clonostachys byssicola]
MAISQRLSPAHSKGEGLNKPLAQAQPKTKPNLLRASEVPSWYATNAFLRTGYRPVNGSVKLCFESLRHIHNETVNIYSHLIPAVIAIACNCFLHLYFHSRFPDAHLADRLAVHIYLTTSIFCFGVSSIYHTVTCHSKDFAGLWNRWDYAGIIIQTTGSFVSGVYMTFYCEPALRKLYWTMTGVLGFCSTTIVVNPRFQGNRWRPLRIATFVAMGLSGLLPVIHATYIYPFSQLNQQAGVGYYLVEGLTLILGTVFYATHFPESWVPEKFDIWGASHQIFHLLVVLSAVIHTWSLLSVYGWIYESSPCLG